MIADEPTGSLDKKNSINIMEIFKEISKDKLVIVVTYHEQLAINYGDKIIKLEKGKIISDVTQNESEKDNIKNTFDYEIDKKIKC